MKPRFYNHIAAHFLAISAQGGGIIAVSAVAIACAPAINADLTWPLGIAIVGASLAAYPLGALLGTMFCGFFFHEIFRRIQGGPFKVGDRVMILRGKRQGKITEVYDVWASRLEVRLKLSDDESKTVADVYSEYEIMKVKEPCLGTVETKP
jgi:hypothetical protein